MNDGGTIHGNVTLYPDSLIYADVSPTIVDGTIILEYENEVDLERMKEVIKDHGIQCSNIVEKEHTHADVFDEEFLDPNSSICTEYRTKIYTCGTCGKEIKRETIEPLGHEYYKTGTIEQTCTTGEKETYRCSRCTAYDSATKEIKRDVPGKGPLGHHYVENMDLHIPATEYASGYSYFICDRCGEVLEMVVPVLAHGAGKHSFRTDDGLIDVTKGKTITEASCTTDGEMDFTCDGCGAAISVAIPATGHSYTDDIQEISFTESNCTTEGNHTYAPVCRICGEYDEAAKVIVNIPSLGHKYSEWENVDKDAQYPCTTERAQERHCIHEGCNDYTGSIQTRIGGETSHTWGDDNITCTICGYTSTGHQISYMLNGGIAPDSLAEISDKIYKPGNTEVLWKPADDKTLDGVWTKQTAGGQAVFAGWSRSNLGSDPYDKMPDTEFVSKVDIPDNADAVVYAVWAMDKNRNGIPDYLDTHVSVIFHENGGTGKVPEALTDVLPGAAYPLETAPELKKGENIFAGWSQTVWNDVITDETTSKAIIGSLATSPYTVPSVGGDVDLYAVYAQDLDDNGNPDYCEDALHVEYYINGGKVYEGYTVDGSGMFYMCSDYHKAGDDVDLLALEHGSMMICRDNAVLIGWSSEPCKEPITSVDREKDLLIKTINLTSAMANGKVYALWAEDLNNNSIADYYETTLTHTYHRNMYLSSNNASTLSAGEYLDIALAEPMHQTGILPGTGVELAANDYFGTAELKNKDGEVKGHYVQVGWSGYSHGACTSKKDYDNWVIAGDANGYTEDGKYYRIIHDARFQNAYAVWATDENENGKPDYIELYYNITLNEDGGTVGDDFENVYALLAGETFTFPTDPVKAGYTFLGWSADGGKTLYKSGESFEVYADAEYTAIYEDNTHTVTLELDGGTAGSDFAADNKVNDGESFTFPADPTKDGYTFLGWSADGDENLYKAGDTVTVNADVTYTAQYERTVYTVTLELNGGIAGTDYQAKNEVGEGDSFTFPEDPTKAGYTFLGWSVGGESTLYKAGDTVTVNSDVTYTAQYEEILYTVTLDVNGGTAGADFEESTTVKENGTFTFPEDPTKTGYTFLGWNTVGDVRNYKAGDSVAVNADVTYTAQYEVNVCTVTLDVNGGVGGDGFTAENKVNEGELFTFPTDPTKAGYTFLGWSAEGDENLYKAGDKIIITSDVTYKAQYEEIVVPKTFKVTLDLNGGTPGDGFTADNTVNEGESFTFPADPTKDGYTFLGWSADGDKNLYKAGDTVTVTADVTYTAQYEEITVPKTFKVTLDLDGGTPGDGFAADNTVNEGESFTFPADPTKAGFTFLGWSADGDKNLYKAGDTVTVNADVTYTAQYEEITVPKTFRVTLDLNGGTPGDGFTADNTVNEGESFTFPADPTKDGFTFLGWNAEGDIRLYKAGDTVKVNSDVSYKAQYEEITVPKTFKVTLDLDGGNAGEGFAAETTVNEGESFTFPTNPTKAGSTFLGWSAEGDEKLYKAGNTVEVFADITFTAQWNLAGSCGGSSSYTVHFETNGGSKVTSQRVSRNRTVKEPTAPTKNGYTFAGWYVDKDLTTEYDFTLKVKKSFTLYAKWNNAESGNGIHVSAPDPGANGAALNLEDHYAYIVGYPDGGVHPDETITRAEVAAIFYRLMSDKSRNMFMTNENSYSDVAPEDWFNTSVSTMSAASVIKGYENGTFAPNQPITRAEFAAMAARFDSGIYSGEDKFPDISEHWAREEINLAAQKGWISGYDDGTFGPDRYITRAEAMCLINRVLGRIPSAEHLLDDMTVWPDNRDKSVWYYADVQEATNSHYYEKNGEYEVWTAIRETRSWA